MASASLVSTPSFAESAARLVERIDYRRAETDEEKESIFRLRYDAYLREGAITPGFGRRVSDRFDETDNAWIFGIHVDDRLVSSIRLNVSLEQCAELPALQVFSDVLGPRIEAGETIVDPTRFVVDRDAARLYPELAHVTLRLVVLATEYFDADLVLATVRSEHQPFYKRLFGHRPACEARLYPTLEKPISLMMLEDLPAARDRVRRRYPFFRATFFERRMLFERHMPHPAAFTPAPRRAMVSEAALSGL